MSSLFFSLSQNGQLTLAFTSLPVDRNPLGSVSSLGPCDQHVSMEANSPVMKLNSLPSPVYIYFLIAFLRTLIQL